MATGSPSRFILGLWRVGSWGLGPLELARYLEAALDLGLDTVDLADIYQDHQCETTFAAALAAAPGLRGRLKVITKAGIGLVSPARPAHRLKHYDTTPAHLKAAVEQALRLLKVERLHQFLIHRPDPLMEVEAVAEVFQALRDSGKVAEFGVSNFTPRQVELLQSRLAFPLAAHQLEVSLLQPAALWDGTLDQAQQLRLEVQAWSPLGGGRLAQAAPAALAEALDACGARRGATPSQVALAWLLAHPARIRPVLGTGRVARLEAARAAEDLPLDRQDWFGLLEAATGREVP